MKPLNSIKRRRHGFSLVELLVVIAVIGVIAALVIPSMSSIFGDSKKAKDQRNAQTIAHMYHAALSSGVTGITGATKDDIINALESGVIVQDASSPFNGKRFSIGNMTTSTQTDVKQYLKLTSGVLDYLPSGGDPDS